MGKVGADLTTEQGAEAAKAVALNILATLKGVFLCCQCRYMDWVRERSVLIGVRFRLRTCCRRTDGSGYCAALLLALRWRLLTC